MPRFITRWTLAAAAAGLIALPAAALAQSTTSSQQPAQPPASQTAAASAGDQSATPADHVREAKQALDSIPKTSIPSADRAKFAQLKTHLDKLQRDVASPAKPGAKAAAGWAADTVAIDKLIAELAGPENETAAPSPTGTTGSSASSSAAAAGQTAQLDDQARTALNQVRQHVAAIASQMSGTAPAPQSANQASGSTSASNPDTMATSPSSASQASSASATQSTTSTPAQSSATGSQTTTPPTQTGTQSSVTQSPAGSSQQPASAQTPAAAQQPNAPQGDQANESAAKQHLTEARDTLSSVTTMPEAAKLQGSARTDVSQLISDFNELITTQINWRDSDQKVEADLTKLLGPQGATGTTGSAAVAPTGTTGTSNPPAATAGQPEASAGNAQLDPAIRAKLVEFRSHLNEFEQSAGGASATTPAASPSSATTPSNPSSSMNPPVSTASTTNPANPATPPASSAASAASGTPGATGTTGSTPPAATGTTGAAPGSAAAEPATSSSLANRTDIERHLATIQNLLNSAKDGKLDKAQTDQLKGEIAQLQQLLGGSK